MGTQCKLHTLFGSEHRQKDPWFTTKFECKYIPLMQGEDSWGAYWTGTGTHSRSPLLWAQHTVMAWLRGAYHLVHMECGCWCQSWGSLGQGTAGSLQVWAGGQWHFSPSNNLESRAYGNNGNAKWVINDDIKNYFFHDLESLPSAIVSWKASQGPLMTVP